MIESYGRNATCYGLSLCLQKKDSFRNYENGGESQENILDNVCLVVLATDAHFYDGHVDVFFCKHVEHHASQKLKVRGRVELVIRTLKTSRLK